MKVKLEVIAAFLDLKVRGSEFLDIWEESNRAVSLDELVRLAHMHGDFLSPSVLKRDKPIEEKVSDLKAEFLYGLRQHHRLLATNKELLKNIEMKIEPPKLEVVFGEFSNNCALAVNSQGLVYVVDHDQCAVFIYSPKGDLIRRFGEKRKGMFVKPGSDEFDEPMDIVMNPDDSFWILEHSLKCMYLYDKEGKRQETFDIWKFLNDHRNEIFAEDLAREYRTEPKPPTRFLEGFRTDDDGEVHHQHQVGMMTLPGTNLLYILMGSDSMGIRYSVLITDKTKYAVRELTGSIREREKYREMRRAWLTRKNDQIALIDGTPVIEFYDNRMELTGKVEVEMIGQDTNFCWGAFDSQGRIFAQNGPFVTVHDKDGKFLTLVGKCIDKEYWHSLGMIRGIEFAPNNGAFYVNSQQQRAVFKYAWK